MNLQEQISRIQTMMEDKTNKPSIAERMIKSIDLFLKINFPYFNKADITIRETKFGSKKYFLNDQNEILAIVDFEYKELVLDRKIFTMLHKTFGDKMDYIVDWFNQEFNENTEYVTF